MGISMATVRLDWSVAETTVASSIQALTRLLTAARKQVAMEAHLHGAVVIAPTPAGETGTVALTGIARLAWCVAITTAGSSTPGHKPQQTAVLLNQAVMAGPVLGVAAPRPTAAEWGRETVTPTDTARPGWCVATTTAESSILGHKSWRTAVR